jgi:DNA-directed RNA polymerase specialized sigma24 family protein
MRVKRGQTWSLADNRRGRITVKVKSVRGPVVRAIVVRTGVELELRRKTIERGQRSARLLSEAGRPVTTAKVAMPPVTKAEARTASDLRKDKAPRGVQAFDERSEKMRRLFEEDHITIKAIAERMGCSRSTVQDRISRARLARQDARHMQASP